MAWLVVPTSQSLSDYSERVQLEGITYVFRFYWNGTEGAWFMDILNENETPLLQGKKVVASTPLTGQAKHKAIPPGDFLAYDTLGRDTPPALLDFGTRVLLGYREASE